MLLTTPVATDEGLPFWLEAFECLPPNLIHVLSALAEGGELQIKDFIEEAIGEKLERDGLLNSDQDGRK